MIEDIDDKTFIYNVKKLTFDERFLDYFKHKKYKGRNFNGKKEKICLLYNTEDKPKFTKLLEILDEYKGIGYETSYEKLYKSFLKKRMLIGNCKKTVEDSSSSEDEELFIEKLNKTEGNVELQRKFEILLAQFTELQNRMKQMTNFKNHTNKIYKPDDIVISSSSSDDE